MCGRARTHICASHESMSLSLLSSSASRHERGSTSARHPGSGRPRGRHGDSNGEPQPRTSPQAATIAAASDAARRVRPTGWVHAYTPPVGDKEARARSGTRADDGDRPGSRLDLGVGAAHARREGAPNASADACAPAGAAPRLCPHGAGRDPRASTSHKPAGAARSRRLGRRVHGQRARPAPQALALALAQAQV